MLFNKQKTDKLMVLLIMSQLAALAFKVHVSTFRQYTLGKVKFRSD